MVYTASQCTVPACVLVRNMTDMPPTRSFAFPTQPEALSEDWSELIANAIAGRHVGMQQIKNVIQN